MKTIEPSSQGLEAFVSVDLNEPVVMLNLLRYREQAVYPDGFDAEPCTGRQAYQRYGEVAVERIATVGGEIVWMGTAKASVIAPEGEDWDDVVLVRYPSRSAFLEMIAQPEYLAAAPHRTASLDDSRLIATAQVLP
ncbi:MAG: hypothetical protein ACI8TX_001719 [Hyphomicrobiaceae bacterium]|jgi:uncharacterized protein (DUF1330 family)